MEMLVVAVVAIAWRGTFVADDTFAAAGLSLLGEQVATLVVDKMPWMPDILVHSLQCFASYQKRG